MMILIFVESYFLNYVMIILFSLNDYLYFIKHLFTYAMYVVSVRNVWIRAESI